MWRKMGQYSMEDASLMMYGYVGLEGSK